MRRAVAGGVAALLLGFSLVACGDGNGSGLTPTRSPTRELPSPTRSQSVEPPGPTDSEPSEDTTEPEPTDSEPSEDTTEPEPSRTPTRNPDSPTRSPDDQSDDQSDEQPSESADAPADEDATDDAADDGTAPTWLWWLLAAAVVGAIVAIPLVRRARRRAAWRQQLSEVEGELGWFARELLPGLRHARSREEVAGGWAVASPRVIAAEDTLTALESSAYDDGTRERARALRDASRLARLRMEQLAAPGPHDTWALDLDAVMADLEAALGPPAPPG